MTSVCGRLLLASIFLPSCYCLPTPFLRLCSFYALPTLHYPHTIPTPFLHYGTAFFASILVLILPISAIILSFPSFFLIFLEKSLPNVWSVRKKVVPLHSLSESNRGAESRMHSCARLPEAEETRSLTDCEQSYKTSSAPTHIYIMYRAHKQKVIPLYEEEINEQWSRMSLAGSDRSIIIHSITVKSLILAQDER